MTEDKKTLVQCDFDGTITEEDVSFMLLDRFSDGDWRRKLEEYEKGGMTVGRFNTEAFSMVKADRESQVKAAREWVRIREGFREMIDCCRKKGFRFVIVSNGLDFYIEAILKDLGMEDIEVIAARTTFHAGGLEVQYVSPDGRRLEEDFKGAWLDSFLGEGYRVIYAGNGTSDLSPARRCSHIFATGTLLEHCRNMNLGCTPFTDFHTVIEVMEHL